MLRYVGKHPVSTSAGPGGSTGPALCRMQKNQHRLAAWLWSQALRALGATPQLVLCAGRGGCDASLLPAVSHPDASCTELHRAEHNEGPRGSSVQDPSGRVTSEQAAKALSAAACWRASFHTLAHPSLAHCHGACPSHSSAGPSHEDPPDFQRIPPTP